MENVCGKVISIFSFLLLTAYSLDDEGQLGGWPLRIVLFDGNMCNIDKLITQSTRW